MPHPPIETYNDRVALKNELLLEKDAQYCSYGDTVHYADPPKIFSRCDGSYLFDDNDTPYLDLQMWYSAASFGYRNQRLNDALTRQLNKLPQLACQYLHPEKVELADRTAEFSQFHLAGPQAPAMLSQVAAGAVPPLTTHQHTALTIPLMLRAPAPSKRGSWSSYP